MPCLGPNPECGRIIFAPTGEMAFGQPTATRGCARACPDIFPNRLETFAAIVFLVPATGIELVTYRLQGGCSTI